MSNLYDGCWVRHKGGAMAKLKEVEDGFQQVEHWDGSGEDKIRLVADEYRIYDDGSCSYKSRSHGPGTWTPVDGPVIRGRELKVGDRLWSKERQQWEVVRRVHNEYQLTSLIVPEGQYFGGVYPAATDLSDYFLLPGDEGCPEDPKAEPQLTEDEAKEVFLKAVQKEYESPWEPSLTFTGHSTGKTRQALDEAVKLCKREGKDVDFLYPGGIVKITSDTLQTGTIKVYSGQRRMLEGESADMVWTDEAQLYAEGVLERAAHNLAGGPCPRCTQRPLPAPEGFVCDVCGYPGLKEVEKAEETAFRVRPKFNVQKRRRVEYTLKDLERCKEYLRHADSALTACGLAKEDVLEMTVLLDDIQAAYKRAVALSKTIRQKAEGIL